MQLEPMHHGPSIRPAPLRDPSSVQGVAPDARKLLPDGWPAPRGGLSRRALVRACEFIHAHLGDRFSLQDLADAAVVSRFHFARMFRVSTGISPMAYLLRLRIDTAKAWLRDGDQRIADIAAALGFCDQSHFSRTFRRMTGVPPRDFAQLDFAQRSGTTALMLRAVAMNANVVGWRLAGAANDDARSSAA